ncbi:hypothetical protein TREMEDRAFT_64463 [Tremella mesenterica DSM 1558]|uniref:uncharacterized protein n=1 Tax=Tremella mesenterica (strain ATCC 24925 / CBS 8224 / DSM 1558 / NBRC 9311 / NRRL Y-6157 / RJB 2259-6 / UBC 559-6) TaxID=578456 RepID=UPI0003F49A84|nr:uncharacterized protein TREMEDRAFT_64463 [Tremella mesenterica DSM 1558]EIW67218.1 hypothetical protein TREMEDRAFT_64463 [Tremella mesenterica DSM 1558]
MVGYPISPTKRARIAEAALHSTPTTAAARFGCSPSTVTRICQRLNLRGHTKTKTQPGRPKKLSDCERTRIKHALLKSRRQSLKQVLSLLKKEGIHISCSLLRSTMRQMGLKRRVARTKPLLTAQHRKEHREWAKQYKDFTGGQGFIPMKQRCG